MGTIKMIEERGIEGQPEELIGIFILTLVVNRQFTLRHYRCPLSNCFKAYGSEGSLSQHIKLKHPDTYI
jgi:hypothetical protein